MVPGQSSADFSPQEPVPGRKEEAGPLGTPAITCCAGAQWEAVAEERMIISLHSDPLERGGGTGNAASLLPIATRTPCAGLGNSKAAVSSGCLTASLSGVCLSLVLPGLLCHSQMTGINQDCSQYSGG